MHDEMMHVRVSMSVLQTVTWHNQCVLAAK